MTALVYNRAKKKSGGTSDISPVSTFSGMSLRRTISNTMLEFMGAFPTDSNGMGYYSTN